MPYDPVRDPWEITIKPPPPPEGAEPFAPPKPRPRPRPEPEPTKDPFEAFIESLKGGWAWWEKEEDYEARTGLEAWQEKTRTWATPYAPPWAKLPEAGPPTTPEAFSRYEEQLMGREIASWQEQVKAWERGEIAALPPPPSDVRLPPDWQEWYGQVTTPELHPRGNVEYYQRQYEGVPEVAVPDETFRMTDEERMSWLNANAYETVFVDKNGNIIDVSEVGRRALVDPDAPIRQVWFMGGGTVREAEVSAGDIEYLESIKPSGDALRKRGEVIGGKWFGEPTTAREGERLMTAKEKEGIKATLESSIVQSVLTSEWSYEDKLSTITDLYSQYTGKVLMQRGLAELRSTVFASLPPEEQEAIRGREPAGPKARVAIPETKVDVGKLEEALSQYGVNLTANYPFISPITQAHLMRIPSETLELMARYLEEKGVSWGDFISVSGGLYGGGGQGGRGRWEIPRQWG